ncbi:MAG: hypothetical protein WC733_04125 [Methylophilus sp.]
MRNFLIATALAVTAFSTSTQAADVGVSVSIGQPGFYGRIDIGDPVYPQPRVIYSQPRIVEHVTVHREPVYMRVPAKHAKHWDKYCHKYGACGYPVYFVQDSWYQHDYSPKYRERHDERYQGRTDSRRDDYRQERYDNDHERGGRQNRGDRQDHGGRQGHDNGRHNGQNH